MDVTTIITKEGYVLESIDSEPAKEKESQNETDNTTEYIMDSKGYVTKSNGKE